MKLRDRKVWGIPLVLVIIFIGIGITVVSAAIMYTLSLPATIIIEEPEEGIYELTAYSDSACTSGLTTLDFGTHRAGTSVSVTFYIKNIGTEDITLSLDFEGHSWSSYLNWHNLTTDEYSGVIRANDVARVTLGITIQDYEEASTISFTVKYLNWIIFFSKIRIESNKIIELYREFTVLLKEKKWKEVIDFLKMNGFKDFNDLTQRGEILDKKYRAHARRLLQIEDELKKESIICPECRGLKYKITYKIAKMNNHRIKIPKYQNCDLCHSRGRISTKELLHCD